MEIGKLNNLKLFGCEYPKEKTGYPNQRRGILVFMIIILLM